ncbi:hypothetical protein BDN72DRAFT_902618 [Pluteus cervinus]|uniref:Uncharacterized protein n=1 Tax=Pluteus cervinus TaxID=181527 RepID=A0ACD3ABD4_9AGAR|nr:hypothetical protein BDN72DRAFT_902618 [Pluteus cervinus]
MAVFGLESNHWTEVQTFNKNVKSVSNQQDELLDGVKPLKIRDKEEVLESRIVPGGGGGGGGKGFADSRR